MGFLADELAALFLDVKDAYKEMFFRGTPKEVIEKRSALEEKLAKEKELELIAKQLAMKKELERIKKEEAEKELAKKKEVEQVAEKKRLEEEEYERLEKEYWSDFDRRHKLERRERVMAWAKKNKRTK